MNMWGGKVTEIKNILLFVRQYHAFISFMFYVMPSIFALVILLWKPVQIVGEDSVA